MSENNWNENERRQGERRSFGTGRRQLPHHKRMKNERRIFPDFGFVGRRYPFINRRKS